MFSTRRRRGAASVEMAIVLPVFFTFMFGLIEYARCQLTVNILKNASRQAARLGATEGISTADAVGRANEILGSAMDLSEVQVLVKDLTTYDGGFPLPDNTSAYAVLPDIELSGAEPRQLFVVRAAIPYNDVALVPLDCFDGLVLSGQSFMRHE